MARTPPSTRGGRIIPLLTIPLGLPWLCSRTQLPGPSLDFEAVSAVATTPSDQAPDATARGEFALTPGTRGTTLLRPDLVDAVDDALRLIAQPIGDSRLDFAGSDELLQLVLEVAQLLDGISGLPGLEFV